MTRRPEVWPPDLHSASLDAAGVLAAAVRIRPSSRADNETEAEAGAEASSPPVLHRSVVQFVQ